LRSDRVAAESGRTVLVSRSALVSPQLRIPELVPAVDVRNLPLTAVDGYVFSRVDGRSTLTEIAAVTGLAFDAVMAIVDKLRALGAIRYQDEAPRRAPDPIFDSQTQPKLVSPEVSKRPSVPPSQKPSSPAGRAAPRRPHSVPPRRLMSESGVSSPPPEMKFGREGTGTFSAPPTGNMRAPSHGASRMVASGSGGPQSGAARQERPGPRPRSLTPPPMERTNPKVYVGDRAGRAGGQGNGDGSFPVENTRQHATVDRAGSPAAAPPPRSGPVAPPRDAGPRLYDPRELDEEVDLPHERRKQLLDLFYRLDKLDYYEALGVLYTADKKDIRAAYFALSKVFHPDSMFRKELGSFKPKMVAVFQFLTEAYECLSKKKTRDEYDGYLRATKATKLAEQALRQAMIEAERPEPAPTPPPPPTAAEKAFAAFPRPQAPPPPVVPPREVSAEARRLAQEVVARRLRGASAGIPQAPKAPPTPEPPPPLPEELPPPGKANPQQLLRHLTRTLKDVAQLTGSHDQVGNAVKAAHAAFARGDLSEATQLMGKAVSLGKDREDLKLEYDRMSKALAEKMASSYREQAKFETKSGKWASAALSWSKVCEGEPNDFDAHLHAAHALFKAGGDMRGAQKYAQQAVFLAPTDIDSRLLLTQIYMTIGLKLNAKRELDAAAKLDPNHEMVKNLLADLKI
jgi:curved DNA-binding protein CbpA